MPVANRQLDGCEQPPIWQHRSNIIAFMLAHDNLTKQIDILLSNERSARRRWYRRPMADLPQWFAEAPDGLDQGEKRKRFDEASASVHHALVVSWLILNATLAASVTWLARHHMTLTLVGVLSAFCMFGICTPLIRRKLIGRRLRLQSQI